MKSFSLQIVLITIINLVISITIFFFHRELTFFLTGNDIRLIDNVNLNSFKAHEEAYKFKLPVLLFSLGISIFILVFLLRRKDEIRKSIPTIMMFINWLGFFLNLVLLSFYFIVPGRIF